MCIVSDIHSSKKAKQNQLRVWIEENQGKYYLLNKSGRQPNDKYILRAYFDSDVCDV